jgi:hypothetical protein
MCGIFPDIVRCKLDKCKRYIEREDGILAAVDYLRSVGLWYRSLWYKGLHGKYFESVKKSVKESEKKEGKNGRENN